MAADSLVHKWTAKFAGMAKFVGVALLGAALLTGCDPQKVAKLEEGVATEAQVRQEFGEPATVTPLPEGGRLFEYPRQPEGWTNYFITIGADGKMTSLRQVLNKDNFAKVKPGASGMEVRNMLGRPAIQQHYDLKNEDVLSWRFKQNGNDSKLFSVTFQHGKAVSSGVFDDPRENR